VLALQRGLRRALGKAAANRLTGGYGTYTIQDAARFKAQARLANRDGHVFGANAWAHLDRYLRPADRELVARADATRARDDRDAAARRLIVAEAHWALANNGAFVYRQYRPMATSLRDPLAHNRTDCSAFVTLTFKAGDAPDPNGLDYHGYGYTGTLVQHGAWLALGVDPRPADLAMFGGTRTLPSHTAIVSEPGWVISFGHTPISRYPLRYRGDYLGSLRYPVT
jgi:hypothetical protein